MDAEHPLGEDGKYHSKDENPLVEGTMSHVMLEIRTAEDYTVQS